MIKLRRSLLTHTMLAALTVGVAVSTDQASAADRVCDAGGASCQGKADLPLAMITPTAVVHSNDQQQSAVSITVDGETVFGRDADPAESRVDKALEDVDIQVKFDGLGVKPILNVSTDPIRRSYVADQEISFLASTNYGAWIDRAEIRIFKAGDSLKGQPLYKLAVPENGIVEWRMPTTGPKDYVYLLRVTDGKGRFDETKPLTLQRTSDDLPQHQPQEASPAPGFSEDRTSFRNIPVFGGAVTVAGRSVPAGSMVKVMGARVPVDQNGNFVIQRILPPGEHDVEVKVVDADAKSGGGLDFNRQINIPSQEWFYVGMADLTVGKGFGSRHLEEVRPGEYDKVYTKGRLAFYLKGKIKGRYILTAAADTDEKSVKHMFKGFDRKDVRQLLRKIDPDEYYPIYGDDSAYVEDAPTRGKFYVRLEKGESHVMWGNFKTNITGSHFLRNERVLYGGNGVYKSESTTEKGEHKTEVRAYAAQPGTVPHRDYLLGTGGSAYFLKYQDVAVGTEVVHIEVRNDVGHVVSRKELRLGFDYEVDYIQGLIQLRTPLSTTASNKDIVQDRTLSGYNQYLVVGYDYVPRASNIHGYVYGGRAEQWVGDNVRVGVTGGSDRTWKAHQQQYGADIMLRKSEDTFVQVEVAKTKGEGYGYSVSDDGGYYIDDSGMIGQRGKSATAYRAEGRVGLEEITKDKMRGHVQGYYDRKGAGFAAFESDSIHRREVWGGEAEVKFGPRNKARIKYEELKSSDGRRLREINTETSYAVGEHIELTPGAEHSKRVDANGRHHDTGKRTDVGLKAKYSWDENSSVYVRGQATVDRTGSRRRNDRVAVGGERPITEKLNATGEVSYGTSGVGAQAGLNYHPTADDHYYFGYRLERNYEYAADVTEGLDESDFGTFVTGAKHRFSDKLSAYTEEVYDPFGDVRSLTQTYGVDYTPSAKWQLNGNVEVGRVRNDVIDTREDYYRSDVKRRAASATARYRTDDVAGHVKGEVRVDRARGYTHDRNSYLISAGYSQKTSKNWRLLTDIDAVFSHKNHEVYDGKFIEATAGMAYRPLDNDKLNALFRYTLLYDIPGPDQESWDDYKHGPRQLNNILSADAAYDINRYLTLGAKYGFRIGRKKHHDGDGRWHKFSGQLGVIRTDFHVVKKWDAMLEGRVLWDTRNNTRHYGAVTAVYREINDNLRMGVGYNWGKFSDDLRDFHHDDRGVFFNVIGKF